MLRKIHAKTILSVLLNANASFQLFSTYIHLFSPIQSIFLFGHIYLFNKIIQHYLSFPPVLPGTQHILSFNPVIPQTPFHHCHFYPLPSIFQFIQLFVCSISTPSTKKSHANDSNIITNQFFSLFFFFLNYRTKK